MLNGRERLTSPQTLVRARQKRVVFSRRIEIGSLRSRCCPVWTVELRHNGEALAAKLRLKT